MTAIGSGLSQAAKSAWRVPPQARALVPLVLPALVVGVGSSLALLLVSGVADKLQHWLFGTFPDHFGFGAYSSAWVVAVLTAAGLVVGLIVWKVPGHAGADPAAAGMVAPPLAAGVLPSLALAAVVGLGSGVSLGPENPITAINIGLAVAAGRRALPRVPVPAWVGLAAAGTIGAMFGTPVAAALLLSETSAGDDRRPLWDRLFGPLVAAGAGALTTAVLVDVTFTVDLPPMPRARPADVGWAILVAAAATVLGLVAVYLFPLVHAAFHRLRHPVLMLTAGGAVLGLLAALGGRLTMFKGLDEMKELTAQAGQHSTANLFFLALAKLAALVVAGACGFRGGRIFPAVFVGVALGLCVGALFSSVPPALAVSCGILGFVLATSRQGWLSLLMAATIVGDTAVLPLLCIAILPAWLLVTGRPEMLITPEEHPA